MFNTHNRKLKALSYEEEHSLKLWDTRGPKQWIAAAISRSVEHGTTTQQNEAIAKTGY